MGSTRNGPNSRTLPRCVRSQIGARRTVLGQAAANEREGEFGSITPAPEIGAKERATRRYGPRAHASVAPPRPLAGSLPGSEFGQQQADAERTFLSEHHAGVDNDCAMVVLDNHQIEPDFTEPTQWNDSNRI